MRRMQVRRHDLHLPDARFVVLLTRNEALHYHSLVKIVAGSFCLSAQLISHAQSAPTDLWTLRLPLYNADASPAIAPDGTIYQATFEGYLLAVTPQGRLKRTFATGAWIDSSPAIGADGTIYFGSHDKKFYALKPDGKLLWSFLTGGQIISSTAIAADGTVYFTSLDGNLYALRPDGSERWRLHTGSARESSPVLGE